MEIQVTHVQRQNLNKFDIELDGPHGIQMVTFSCHADDSVLIHWFSAFGMKVRTTSCHTKAEAVSLLVTKAIEWHNR